MRTLARRRCARYEAPVNALVQGTDPRIAALLDSYERFFGRRLCEPRELFEAPFVVLAHGTQQPPVLFYGNRAALSLWEMDWDAFTSMPSLRTAEPDARAARQRLLAEVERQGYSANYTGVRVSSTGKRFEITRATVWNILDAGGRRIGQAATFREHRPLPAVE